MKQGTGRTTMSGRKMEPMGRSYTPGVVSQIGEALGNHATDCGPILHGASAPMYEDKNGHMAPGNMGMAVYKGGSQGRRE